MKTIEIQLTEAERRGLAQNLVSPIGWIGNRSSIADQFEAAMKSSGILTAADINAAPMAPIDDDPIKAFGQIFGMLREQKPEEGLDDTVQKTFTFSLDRIGATEFSTRIFTGYGMLMEPELLSSDDAATRAIKKACLALSPAFPDILVPGGPLAPHAHLPIPERDIDPAHSEDLDPNGAHIAIASEVGGDIAGYYVLDAAALAKMGQASDPWEFLCDEDKSGIACHNTLKDALADLQNRKLTLAGDFGVGVY